MRRGSLAYASDVPNPPDRRRPAFAVALAVLVIVSIAVARLPDSFVEQLRRGRPFDISQSGWIYRLLAIMAVTQAVAFGYAAFRTERIAKARQSDPALARMSKPEVVGSVARNAAMVALLTLVYGLSAFGLTGERGGYWLFAFVCLLQLAWYYRQTGQVAQWLRFQPEFVDSGDSQVEPDHVPPLARGVTTDADDA